MIDRRLSVIADALAARGGEWRMPVLERDLREALDVLVEVVERFTTEADYTVSAATEQDGQPTYLYAHLRALTARGLLEKRKVAGNFTRWRITDEGRELTA